jgi:hypothetical protein
MQDWKLSFEVTQIDGRNFVVSLKNVKFVPEICSNLFSLNKALMNGFILANDGVIASLTKKQVTLIFDVVIKTVGDGCVTGVMMKPIDKKRIHDGYAHTSIGMERSLDINHLHNVFGYCGLETLKSTSKMYGLKHSGNFQTCEEYAVAKARQKNVNKSWLNSSDVPGDFTSTLAQLQKRTLEELSSGPSLLTTTLIIAGVYFKKEV